MARLDTALKVPPSTFGGRSSKEDRSVIELDPERFNEQFQEFKRLVPTRDDKGRAFTNFQEGLVADWEDYKSPLRDRALGILEPNAWVEEEIGTGKILRRMVDAIEIHDDDLRNNLVPWPNRYGHKNRAHSVLLDAKEDPNLQLRLERLLFGLYRSDADEGATFERLTTLTGRRYPLLAYLYFLKDMDRFMPCAPRTFDRAFRDLRIDLVTERNCSWENFLCFNAALGKVREALAAMDGLTSVRLIDAHSFCWMLVRMRDRRQDYIEDYIIEMRNSVENTVRNANGQLVERRVKNKELRMPPTEFDQLLGCLLDRQCNRCALTGIPFRPAACKHLRPSVDRIDSNGHYEHGNLQVVCRFVNFWKAESDNEEFKRLLMLVRGEDHVPV